MIKLFDFFLPYLQKILIQMRIFTESLQGSLSETFSSFSYLTFVSTAVKSSSQLVIIFGSRTQH